MAWKMPFLHLKIECKGPSRIDLFSQRLNDHATLQDDSLPDTARTVLTIHYHQQVKRLNSKQIIIASKVHTARISLQPQSSQSVSGIEYVYIRDVAIKKESHARSLKE